MGLAGASADELARTKSALDAFLSDAAKLAAVRQLLAEGQGVTAEQRHVLAILEKTFKVGRRGAGDRQASACACCQVSWGLRECRHSQQQQSLNKLAWSTLPKLPSGAADLHHRGRAGGAGGAGQGMKSGQSPPRQRLPSLQCVQCLGQLQVHALPSSSPPCALSPQYKERLNQLEAELQQHRNNMALGYTVGVRAGGGEEWHGHTSSVTVPSSQRHSRRSLPSKPAGQLLLFA